MWGSSDEDQEENNKDEDGRSELHVDGGAVE